MDAGRSETNPKGPRPGIHLVVRRALLLLAIFATGVALAVGGCGGNDDNGPAATNGTTTSDGYSRY